MKTINLDDIIPLLMNANRFYGKVNPNYTYSSEFWNWLETEYSASMIKKQNHNQLGFKDERLFDLFVLRFSS